MTRYTDADGRFDVLPFHQGKCLTHQGFTTCPTIKLIVASDPHFNTAYNTLVMSFVLARRIPGYTDTSIGSCKSKDRMD